MIFVIATLAIPTQLGIIPLFIVMRQLGWTGELGAVIVPTLVTAFGVFFMRQYLVDVIPDELIEAARVDGANQFRIFLTVAVPAARPAAAILGLFTFMATWTDFLWPLIVLNPTNPTLQTALSQLQSGYYIDYSIVLTGAILATIPLLVLFIGAGRQLDLGHHGGGGEGVRPPSRWLQPASSGEPRPPLPRSRAPPTRTAKRTRSGTTSPARPATSPTATPPSAPSTTTTGCRRTSR